MGYSEAARAGVREFGPLWRGRIYAKQHIDAAVESIGAGDRDRIVSSFRSIHKAFSRPMKKGEMSSGEEDALEWFEMETPDYEIEKGLLHEFRQEFEYRMNELYDFADYNRLLVK